MGWKEKFTKLTNSLFESEPAEPPPQEEQHQPLPEPLLLLEPAENVAINGDIDSVARQLLEEELARVTSGNDENSIFKVEACLPFIGDFSPPETVCTMLRNVAGKDPQLLAEDGKLRIATIEQVISEAVSQARDTLQETSNEAENIKAERIALSEAYAEGCDSARKSYEEKVSALQKELEDEMTSLKEKHDSAIAEIEERSKQNAKRREETQSLSRAIDAHGRSMIEKISKLLSLITPSDRQDSN